MAGAEDAAAAASKAAQEQRLAGRSGRAELLQQLEQIA
eukprot:COSAG06_NODE_39295_length_414_cov_0.920635_1_plen_37_part_01